MTRAGRSSAAIGDGSTGQRALLSAASVLLLVAIGLGQRDAAGAEPTANEIRPSFEQLAREMKFFAYGDFMYNRWDGFGWLGKERKEYLSLIGRLKDLSGRPSKTILPLTKHANPRVRTLALAALFQQEDPFLLPHIYTLVNDRAKAFPRVGGISVALGMGNQKRHAVGKPRSVGEMAQWMIGFYVGRGPGYSVMEAKGGKSFKDYWAERKDRKYCVSWHLVKYQRATGGTHPVRKSSYPLIRALRNEVDRLPKLDRAWTLLALSRGDDERILASDDEYLAACKDLGRERLLNLLRRKIDSDDPDFRPGPYGKMIWPCSIVLANAKALLRPEDADVLLDLAKRRDVDGYHYPAWSIAAGRLQPQRQRAILKAAMKTFPSKYEDWYRSQLACELWDVARLEELAYLKELFYSEGEPYSNGYGLQGELVIHISRSGPRAEARRFMRAILMAEAHAGLRWIVLTRIAQACNKLADKEIIAKRELSDLHHPIGEYHFSRDQGFREAKAKFPKETRKVLGALTEWRRKLREYAEAQWK